MITGSLTKHNQNNWNYWIDYVMQGTREMLKSTSFHRPFNIITTTIQSLTTTIITLSSKTKKAKEGTKSLGTKARAGLRIHPSQASFLTHTES